MDLYSKVCLRLRNWEFPDRWPTKPIELLTFAHQEMSKLLPYVTAFTNLYRMRPDLGDSRFDYRGDLNFVWLANPPNQTQLVKRLREWIYKMPKADSVYFATCNSKSHKLETVLGFNVPTLIGQFSINSAKDEYQLNILRSVVYWLGNPLATVEFREFKSKAANVLCIPKEVISYGI